MQVEARAARARARGDRRAGSPRTPRPRRSTDEEADELRTQLERLERAARGARPGQPARGGGARARDGAAARSSTEQREDLERSLAELEQASRRADRDGRAALRGDLRGGRAALRRGRRDALPGRAAAACVTTEGEEDEEPGIEIELQPAGKRVTRLSLLSGGEKALGAISFLFALFLARPCPFYLLDEVEAALDDANIGRFVELLRRFADRAQFIVVTHQKRTMEAADILYGVTMGADGVSQVVSKRLAARAKRRSSARDAAPGPSSSAARQPPPRARGAERLVRPAARLALDQPPGADARAELASSTRPTRRPGSGSRRR